MKPIKRSLKQILNRNKKSIVLSNSLENLLGELKSKHKYVIVDDYDTLMDSLKNISSSFFPDFVNFYKFEDNQNLIDPIYQDNIHIQNDIRPLIYSPPMQRLNHIRQLSFAYLEYKGANHTRFDHSLGVYHLTEKVYKKILIDGIGLKVIAISTRKTIFPTIIIPRLGDSTNYIEIAAGWNLLVEIGINMGINLDKTIRARKVGHEFNSS